MGEKSLLRSCDCSTVDIKIAIMAQQSTECEPCSLQRRNYGFPEFQSLFVSRDAVMSYKTESAQDHSKHTHLTGSSTILATISFDTP